MRAALFVVLFASLPEYLSAGCTDGGGGGCSPPVGAKWDRWDMAGSTYTYCYHGCAVDWLYNNTDTHVVTSRKITVERVHKRNKSWR